MSFSQFLLLHLMAGSGVAAAVYLTARGTMPQRAFQVASAVLFWPFYLPIVLAGRTAPREPAPSPAAAAPVDDLARAISQVDAELEGALHSLDGWAEGVLCREKERLHELRQAWIAQADRIREMDRHLARPEYADLTGAAPDSAGAAVTQRILGSQKVIRQNLERLKRIRGRTLDDLLGTLAWVRELVSMIHLAKFTGAPASRAEELVSQIAAAVEGVSALTWAEEETATPHERTAI